MKLANASKWFPFPLRHFFLFMLYNINQMGLLLIELRRSQACCLRTQCYIALHTVSASSKQQIAEITGTHRIIVSPENYSSSSPLAYKHYDLHVFYTQELTEVFHSEFFHKSFRCLVSLFTICIRKELDCTVLEETSSCFDSIPCQFQYSNEAINEVNRIKKNRVRIGLKEFK